MTGTFFTLGPFDVPPDLPQRHLRVYVPMGNDPDQVRPVLYLFDGQNVFTDEGSFSGGWHAHDASDKLLRLRKAVAPIVVGIEHGGARRIDELGPWAEKDEEGKPRGGHTDHLLSWIESTVMPHIQSKFQVELGPTNTFIGGSSMGGLAAMYAHIRRPDLFGGALCMSPSFWFAKQRIQAFVASQPRPQHSRIYLDVGLREVEAMTGPATELATYLRARGYSHKSFLYRPDKRGTHAEPHWRRRLPLALKFLFDRDASDMGQFKKYAEKAPVGGAWG